MDSAMEACMAEAYARQYREGYTELWTDGSYDDKDHRAGIGIMIRQMRAPGSVNTGPEQDIKAIFGKAVKASDSQEAELYAMAVGLSYLLDACPDVKSVRLRYDCVGASVTAANIDAYASRGAPYTNFRSAYTANIKIFIRDSMSQKASCRSGFVAGCPLVLLSGSAMRGTPFLRYGTGCAAARTSSPCDCAMTAWARP